MDPKRMAELAGVQADEGAIEREENFRAVAGFIKQSLVREGFPVLAMENCVDINPDTREVTVLLEDDPAGLDIEILNHITSSGIANGGYRIRPYDNIRMELVFTLKDNFEIGGVNV